MSYYNDPNRWIATEHDGYMTNTGYISQSQAFLRIGQRVDIDGIENLLYRGFLYFNTPLLGEGIKIRSAKLYLNIETMVWDRIEYNKRSNFQMLKGKWKGEYPADFFPSASLQEADFLLENYHAENCIVTDTSPVLAGWNEFDLTPFGCDAIIGGANSKFMFRHLENDQTGYIQAYSRQAGADICSYLLLEYTLKAGVTKRLFIRPDGCQKGDIFYWDNGLKRLQAGTENQELEIGSDGMPQWSD